MLRGVAEAAGWGVPGAAGYSAVELWSVAAGLQTLFAAGLAVLYRVVADEYGRPAAALGVLGCWLGTSLFYYSALFPFMAHAASFALLALVLRAGRGLATEGATSRRLAWLGLLAGSLFLVRPQQVCVMFFLLPLLASAVRTRPAAGWLAGGVVGAALAVAAVALQLGFNYTQFGAVTLSGYASGGEGFSWLNPRLSLVLLDPSRGLLVYSPVVALAALGYARFARSVPAYVWPAVGNAVTQVYLIAAWSSPEQGDSFGARMWSDNAAVVAVGLALAFRRSPPAARWVLVAATLVAVGWSTFLLGRYVGLVR